MWELYNKFSMLILFIFLKSLKNDYNVEIKFFVLDFAKFSKWFLTNNALVQFVLFASTKSTNIILCEKAFCFMHMSGPRENSWNWLLKIPLEKWPKVVNHCDIAY